VGIAFMMNILNLTYSSQASFAASIIIVLFFAVVFGPWVGLIVGGLGELLLEIIVNQGMLWGICASFGLMGFIAGFSMLYTRGYYNSFRSVLIAEIFGAIGIVVCFVATYFTFIFALQLDAQTEASALFYGRFLPQIIIGLIALPIMLVIYNALVRFEKRP
jgi:uncharacterized membrane protein